MYMISKPRNDRAILKTQMHWGGGRGSYVLQHISFCQPANSGAYHAARSNKKGIRKLTAGGE